MDLRKSARGVISSDKGIFSYLTKVALRIYRFFFYKIPSAEYVVKRDYKRHFGTSLNLRNPQKLNEKLQWLKLYDRERWHCFYADKYVVRDYLGKTFGEAYLVPLLFSTKRVKDLRPENITEYPCIVKSNHACGQWRILRSPDDVDWRALRRECRLWLSENWYDCGKEYQYKFIEPRIMVEKLLETESGRIPNDYKLHFINGELAFIYVSVDREGENDRCVFDKDWNRLPFVWIEAWKYRGGGG